MYFLKIINIFLNIFLLITAPQHVDLCPGPFEDTQFDAVVDVETSEECMDDEGRCFLLVLSAVNP